ncbi:MAG: ATP-dependent RNA helicase HrpA [Puniceicoccaceae bacterium]
MFDPAQIRLPEELPISQQEEVILRKLREHQVVIIRGETGSGKTTQIPKLCLKAGLGKRGVIGCTQPRRVAAFAVANRIAEELGPSGGSLVGTKIRFTDQTNRRTRIKVMTDGILLNEMQRDPLLRAYSVVVVDEAHERSLNIDFILGHLIQIRERRPDLKIIVTSATIDTQQFSEAFGGAPVIEVTGRIYPVEVRYQPFDEREENFTYIEACDEAVQQILSGSRQGDILVFLPAEKDIRELCDRLDGAYGARLEVVPLFVRLSQSDQQRIFRTGGRRKVVVATNIAETSITVPGIRYVVDSGLARISRYSSHSRTQRLPIEPISQSSANQRKGRCGRVSEGVCIRLYSEEDFASRPEFTPPEIFRSNLAAVILRLKAFKFGTIEQFPFLDRPESRAIQGGMILLKELRAIDENEVLTEIGRKLARLPIDPTIGRMLIEARERNVLRSVLIIASGLSIQDPRERPLEKEAKADQEHQKFKVKGSDFLSLLQIWKDFDEKYEKWSQSKMRIFCRDHFISYQRLREWREIHQQIRAVLEDMDRFDLGDGTDDVDAIHCSILTGLIGNVAFREQGNWFQATRGRKVMVFPGSVMFQKQLRHAREASKSRKPERASGPKEWVMAAEFVETSRLFARTLAVVDPQWIRKAGAHLMKVSYQEPHWSVRSQRVLAWKKEFLYGLLIDKSRAGYGRVDAAQSKEILIRSGILEKGIRDHFAFLDHNAKVAEEVVELQTRFRRTLSYDLDYRLYQFYDERLPEISSVAELHRWWRGLSPEQQEGMLLKPADLLDREVLDSEKGAFPDQLDLGGITVRVDYRYRPGEVNDGATLRMPITHFVSVQEGSLDWMIPGLVEPKVEHLLRTLPKDYRRFLSPVREKCTAILSQLRPSPKSLVEELTAMVATLFDLRIPMSAWDLNSLPEHLRLKIELTEAETEEVVACSSDWNELQSRAEAWIRKQGGTHSSHTQVEAWKQACVEWERANVTSWSFPDLPESIEVTSIQGVPLMAYPSLVQDTQAQVSVRLLKHREQALLHTPAAYRRLCEMAVGREMGWFLRDLKQLKPVCLSFSDVYVWEDFAADVEQLVRGSLFSPSMEWPLRKLEFESRVQQAILRLRGMRYELGELLERIGKGRLELLNGPYASHSLTKQLLQRLLPKRFMRIYHLERLEQVPRYLQAHVLRLQRAAHHPAKDVEKAERLQPLLQRYVRLSQKLPGANARVVAQVRDLFFALEEFRVSVFAQELGTHGKVSQKSIEQQMSAIEELIDNQR